MGLTNASHGNSISTLSCSDPAFRNGTPTYSWPIAPLPEMKYPFIENTKHNEAEEARCLDAALNIIKKQRTARKDVGAIIVEPMSGLGNKQATPTYYKKLRKIAA